MAYEKIKDMIFHMEFLPGIKISEPQISERLSISRTPVHDALRRLAAEGLVKIGTNRGAAVAQFTDEEVREIGTIRLSQDILSAQLAAYYGSAADFEQLCRLADVCEEAAVKGDIYGRIKADNDFHLEISRVSGNSHLYKQQYAIYQQVHLIQISKYTDIEDSLIQIHHHVPIIESIRNADLKEAARLICDHIKDFYRLDPYLMKCYGYSQDAE
nr:GntR family transcriptional regulator [uncultured Anaerostipes sp.]